MAFKLPIYDSQDQTFRVDIFDVEYVVRLRYLERPASWYLDMGVESDGVVSWIVLGRRVVKRFPLLLRDQDERLPADGDLYALPTGSYEEQLTEETLGDSIDLVWLTSAEVEELQPDTETIPPPTIIVP